MNFKSKKLDYFKEHWKRQIFLKGVCMIVSACIILNIINLPAYANTQEDLRKKAFSRENKQQDVLYQKDTSFNSVSVMNSLEANIKIDKKTENIFVGKELKGFLSKEKDGQGRRKVMVHKGESFEEDEVLTAMVDNKLKGRKSSSGVETRQISQDQRSQDQRSQEQSLSVKEGESTRQQKDKSAQEQESKEEVKEETRQSQSPKEERVAKQQGAKEGVEKEAIEEARREQEQRSKQESQGEQEERETEREGSINAQEQVLQGQRDIDVEKASYTSKRVQELAESLEKEEKDRDKVIEEIAEQTGLSKEQVEEELSKLDEAQRKGVIAALAKLFGQGKDIVYCVAEVLGTVLNETNKGLLGFAAILAEAIAGIFVKNNQDLISGKSEQLMLSAQAIQTVLRKYGKEYVGIDTNIDDIIAGLNVGESAIVHVGTNHFITITKNEDGTFTKTDINKSQETLTAKELKSALEREYGLKEGQTTTVLVKDDNEKFKGIKRVDTLGEVLGAEREEYVGIEININHIIEGLNVGESVIVYVVRDRCVTITKNEDGTFTKTDNVNNTPETLTAQELKRVMVEQYDLKEEQITRVVVRADNEKFKRIVYDLSEAIGAQRQWDKSQFEGKSQEEYYRQYGEESYEKLMIQMYGTTSLSPEQSREFAAFYEKFLEAAIIDIDKTMSDEKASEESKEVAKALKTQAAKELAIIEGTLEVLREHVGVVSGQVGQVLLIQERAYPNESQGIAEGEYYQVITIYADDLKEQHSIVGSDGKSVSIESYRISRGWSISTREGVRVTRSDGSTYQVFGIGGKFEGMEVGFEYIVAYNANGTFYMDEQANIYLLNDTDRVYQAREERGSRPPTSGMYKGAAPERENWTHGKIIETESGYMIYGAGSKITVRKTSRGWEADAIGIGTEAMRGSVLRISANDPNGVAATIFLDIKEGFMVYAGNYWVPSDGFIWQYDESVTAEQIEQFIKNTISTQLGSNAEGIEEIELIYGEAVEAAKAKAKEKAEEEIEEERKKYASEIPPAQYKAAHKKEIEEKAQEYYEDIYEQEVAQTKEDFKNKKMLGAPFSTEAIFKSMGISAKIHTKAGFTYDGTKSDGDIYKLTIESATVLEIKEQDGELVTVATEDIRVKAVISEGGWELDSGGTTLTDSIKQGQVFSFATVLNNAGRQIVNTREIEIITGYEISGHDEKGNNYYDYSKPKYSKMDPGTFKVGGNSDGKYILINNLYISISKGNWEVMQEQSGSQYDKTEENCAYWHEGAQITISKRGNTFDISISKGDLTVKNLTVTLYHKMNDSSGGGDDSDDSYEGPRIEGAYITDYKELYNNMYSYKIQTGTFKGVSGEQGTQNSLGNFMFVPGSDFKKGSIIQADATRAKYDSKIKKDGSIDAYGAKWYEKLRDGIVGFFSILAFSLMTIFTLGAMIWAKEMKGMGWAKEWAAITYGYWNHVEADGSNKEAVQRGMDLGIAGLAAVAILVVAAISIAGSIFTGGASIIGAIGAVVALAGAVASSVSAINLTNSAIQAFRAGKGGQGALMLFFALLTVVLACVGAGQMGSTIASGLATLGKQFFIKMAVGAVIGAAAGAGIAAASYGIRYAIDKSKGRAEDFDWAEFGKEVGIGAITGAFAGAAAGAQVATAVAKSVAKGVAQEVAKGVGEGVAKAVGEEVAEDVSKEITKQVSKEVGEELAGSIAGKVSKDVLSQITGSLTKGVSVEVGKEVAKNVAKEVGEGVAEEVAKDVSKEVAKNVVDDLATNVAKSVEAQIVKELSGEVSKEVGEKIAKSVAEKVAKSISRSIAEKVGEEVPVGVGEIAKELILGGTSFKRQAGQTTLQFVGTVTKSVITVVSRVGMQALNGYMTYMSAKSFVDCMEKGDVLGAAKALYTLVSINIIMPVMSGHSAIKEDGTLKASDLAKEGAGDLTSTAKNTEVVTKGITIQGMSIGWKVGSVAITTVVGAGVGVGISVIIDLVSGKKIKAKDLIIGGGVGATIGFGFGALATKADWTMLGNSVKTSLAKTFAPFAGRTANLVRGADGDIVVQELSEFSGSTMVRSWVGLVGGGAIGVGIGAGIWAVKGHKKEDMARYLIVGGVGGSVVGAGFANAWSSGGYKGAWANFKANPKAVFMEAKGYLQESLVKSVTMVQEINMFNTYMAYSTGILNQIYNKITGESLANTDIVKFINKVTGMNLFKSQADIEEDTEFEKRKKKAQEKGEEFKEEGVVYKAEFGQEEANAVIEQNWGSLTSPTMYASNVVGGFLKPVLGPALQHSPILGSVMNVMESAGSVSIMQKHKIVSMFYNMGVKIRLLNIISKQVFDDPNDPEDDQIAEVLGGFAFMQMFETMAPQTMPAQTQAEAEKFLTSGQEISKMVDGNQIKVALGEEVYNSATLLKKASSKEKFEGNLKTVCSNLGLSYEVVSQEVGLGKNYNQIVSSLVIEYVLKGVSERGALPEQIQKVRSELNTIVETSPIMKQGAGLSSFDIINSISCKLNYLYASAKILELNVEGIRVESIASGSLSKGEYKKILQAQDAKETGSGVVLLMNYLSGISSVNSLPINELIGAVSEYNNKLFELKEATKATLAALKLLNLSEDQINRISEIVLKEGSVSAENKLTEGASQEISKVLGKAGTEVVVKLIVGNLERNINIGSIRNAFENVYSQRTKITIGYMMSMLATSVVSKEDPLTKELMRSLEKQLFRADTYVVYTTFRDSPALKEVGEIESLRNIIQQAKADLTSTLKSLSALKLSDMQINKINEIVLKEGAVGSDNKLTREAQEGIQEVVGSKVVTNLVVRNIEELRSIEGTKLSAEQKGQLALLEAIYMPQEISLNTAINNLVKEVASGKLSYEEFNLVIGASDILYSRVTSVEQRKKLADYRKEITVAAVNMTKEVIKETAKLQKEGQITKGEAKGFSESIRNAFNEVGKVGNISSLMGANANARRMLSSIRERDIVQVVDAQGKFLSFDTSAGKNVIEVNRIESTAKGMKINLTVDGKNIGDVVLKGNLEALSKNEKLAQAIVEKYPNMLATDIALNRALSEAIKPNLEVQANKIIEIASKAESLDADKKVTKEARIEIEEVVGSKDIANKIINSIEDGNIGGVKDVVYSSVEKIIEVLNMQEAFSKEDVNKLTEVSKKTIQELVRNKEVANNIIRSIEEVKFSDLKKALQEALSGPEALVLGEGSFRIDGEGKQIENKGYILSSQAKSAIFNLLGATNATRVIDSIDAQLNTEKIVNDIKTFKTDASQLIKLCSANVNPRAISMLFSHLEADISPPDGKIKMSLADLAILCEQTQNAIAPQLKAMINKMINDKMIDDEKEVEKAVDQLSKYLKDSSLPERETIFEQVKEKVKYSNNVENSQLYEIVNQHLDVSKIVSIAIEEIELMKGEGKSEEEIVDNANLKFVFENSGYLSPDALLPRLKLLREESAGKTRLEMIQEEFYGKGGYVEQAKGFIETNTIEVEGKKKLKEGTIDSLRAKVIAMDLEGKGTEAVNLLRITLNECMRQAVGFGIRGSQSELTTTLQNDINAALGMGGGKTVSLALDAATQRVLMGSALNLEILVGNSDLENYVGGSSQARKFFEFVGMKAVSINDFKPEGGQTNIGKLKEAYQDPNVVVIMDPTMRGHMMNEAVSRGGESGRELREVLESVNRVTVDEVHLWALTRTAAVIGGDNKPPDKGIIKKAVKIGDLINAEKIYKQIIKPGAIEKTITIEKKEVLVKRFNKEADLIEAKVEGEYIAIIGEQTASIEIRMSKGIRDVLINKIGSAPKGYTPAGMLYSVIKGLFTSSENGGMAIGEDGKVKPVGATGVQENMVINDIYSQLGFALKKGIEKRVFDIRGYMSKSTQMSNTSMQTSLAAIYSGASARMVGISGTVSGLEQLIINRTGSGKIYNITGERVDPSMFNSVMEIGTALSKEVIKENLKSLSELNLNESVINDIAEIVAKKGALDANNKLTQEAQEEIKEMLKKDIEKGKIKEATIKIISGSIGDGLTAKITNVLIKAMQDKTLSTDPASPDPALNNALLLGKTQGTIENFRSAVKKAIENVGGIEALDGKVEIFEFTDKQGKWTGINEKREVEVSGDLGNNMKSITDVAKNKNIRRIIIANEMGATGVDYQGNYLNIIADAHLMSNTDLAQALKRTARPNNSFSKEGGLQRWTTERVIMYDKVKVQSELDAFKNNVVFVEYAKKLWEGAKAGGNMEDAKSVKWLEVMEKGNFDISNAEVIEGLYKLSGGYKEGDKIDTKSPEVIDIAMKEAITFISKIQDLRSVDGSIRFTINDSIRDRMVLSVLRNVVAGLPEGKAKEAAVAELNDALKNNSSVTKDIFEVKEKKKAESAEEVMRKAFDNSVEEAKQRLGRLQEVLKGEGTDERIAKQEEVMKNHLESIRIAMSDEMYYNSKPIRGKGLGDAIDMTEFMQIIRSYEEYIMPMATVVDRAETISIERGIEDNRSKAVKEYVKKDNTLSIVNERGERVVTEKGALFVRMMKEELSKESTSVVASYAWLANKIGSSYEEINKDLNIAEQTHKQIENVKKIVDKLVEINKEMRYEAVRKVFVMEQEDKNKEKKYSKEEIEEALNKKNEEYVKEIEKLKRVKEEIGEVNKRIREMEEKIVRLEEEYENHMVRFNEEGIDEGGYEIVGEIGEIRREEEEARKKVQGYEREVEGLNKEEKNKEEVEVRVGERVEELTISEMGRRVKEDIEKEAGLSKIDKYGERVLTQKGKIYAKIAKEIVGGNKEFGKFLMEGPIGKLEVGDKGNIGDIIRAKMSNKGEVEYNKEIVKDITEGLWGANIWEYEKIEKMYGIYGLLGERGREVIEKMSVSEMKGILNAQHSQTVKGLAEQKGYSLPDAESIALARLAKGLKGEGEEGRVVDYLVDIVDKYEKLEESVGRMMKTSNGGSETSIAGSRVPGFLKKGWAGIGSAVRYFSSTKWALRDVSESVDISIKEAIGIVGTDREKVRNLVSYAGEVGRETEEGLDNFDSIVKSMPKEEISKVFESHINIKKVVVTGVLIAGGIGIVAGMSALSVFVGPLAGFVGIGIAIVIGIGSGLGVVGSVGLLWSKISAKFNKKIIPKGDYIEKLKISDIEKFAKLKVFTGLIRKGKIDLRKEEDKEKVTNRSLYKGVKGARPYMQEVSDEEGILILGKRGLFTGKGSYDAIKTGKEDTIKDTIKDLMKKDGDLRKENGKKEGETEKSYEDRLEKLAKSEAELGFRWSIGLVKRIIESEGYEEKGVQEKVLAVVMGEGSNTEEMLRRYKQVSEIGEIVDQGVEIKVLKEKGMFNEDNSISKEFINKYVKPELIIKSIERKLKEAGYKGEKVGEKVVGKMVEGYSKGEELNKAIVKTLALFEDVDRMYEYLGMERTKGVTKEEIGEGAYRTYKKALGLLAEGKIGEEGLRQETEIIRTVSEMLMIGLEKPELEEAINEKEIGQKTLEKIERMVNIESTKVNKYVFINEIRKEMKGRSRGDSLFELNIEEIKEGLERKEEKGEILPKEINDLLPDLGKGNRGKKYQTALTMEMRNARAVSQAA